MKLYDSIDLPGILTASPTLAGTLSDFDKGRTCAHKSGDITFYIRIRRSICSFSAKLHLYTDTVGTENIYPMEFYGLYGDYDEYRITLTLNKGLYYYTFCISADSGLYYVHNAEDEYHGQLREEYDKCGKFQLLLYDFTACSAFCGGAMYHIFVDRFDTGGKIYRKPDSPYNDDWENGIPEYSERQGDIFPNNTHFGGNLDGIREKLDYIQSVGCDIIYLSPIFEGFSNHKYDTGDYSKIDPCFGGIRAFHRLTKEAHRRGMKIILDGVFNHTGSDSVYFNKNKAYNSVGAYNSKKSKYFPWYSFTSYPDGYDCWWGVKTLPKLNGNNSEVRKFFCGENGIVRRWLREGADGWRLDVADELSDLTLNQIKSAASAEKAESFIIGEVWEDASNKIAYGQRRHYFTDSQLGSVMNYPLRDAIINYTVHGGAESFAAVYNVILMHYPYDALNNLMNFLGSHDTERIITVLAGKPSGDMGGTELSLLRLTDEEYETGKTLVKFAFALLCCCPGIPCIYYGDEAGMQGYRDPFNRRPFPWSKRDTELTECFSDILSTRKNTPALLYGNTSIIYAQGDILIILREYQNNRVYCIFNSGNDKYEIPGYNLILKSKSYILIKENPDG